MRIYNFWPYRRLLFSAKFAKSVWNARNNLAAAASRLPLPAGPYMAELDVTYRCNLKCRMCRRWMDSRREELSLGEYETLAEEFQALGVHQVSIAGGEPLLREDVFGIIAGFAKRGLALEVVRRGTKTPCDQPGLPLLVQQHGPHRPFRSASREDRRRSSGSV